MNQPCGRSLAFRTHMMHNRQCTDQKFSRRKRSDDPDPDLPVESKRTNHRFNNFSEAPGITRNKFLIFFFMFKNVQPFGQGLSLKNSRHLLPLIVKLFFDAGVLGITH